MILLEATTRSRWVDLTFGLTDGWWRFADHRQDHPLLTAAEWRALLVEQGFTAIEVIEQGGQAVILAPAERAFCFIVCCAIQFTQVTRCAARVVSPVWFGSSLDSVDQRSRIIPVITLRLSVITDIMPHAPFHSEHA